MRGLTMINVTDEADEGDEMMIAEAGVDTI